MIKIRRHWVTYGRETSVPAGVSYASSFYSSREALASSIEDVVADPATTRLRWHSEPQPPQPRFRETAAGQIIGDE